MFLQFIYGSLLEKIKSHFSSRESKNRTRVRGDLLKFQVRRGKYRFTVTMEIISIGESKRRIQQFWDDEFWQSVAKKSPIIHRDADEIAFQIRTVFYRRISSYNETVSLPNSDEVLVALISVTPKLHSTRKSILSRATS